MKNIPTLFVLFLSTGTFAQSWCPPGATWTYEAGQFLAGYRQMTYTHDSIVDGHVAQIIDHRAMIQYPLPNPPYWTAPYESYAPVSVITRVQGEVVFIWSTTEIAWDTLYWYGAAIGDHWYPAHTQPHEDCSALVVSDTGTTVFDGLPLHWVEVDGLRVYERIGSAWDMFLYCPDLIWDGPAGIRCYSDNDIAVGFTNYGCETLVGVKEQGPPLPPPYPNPGTTHFTLELPQGQHTITLFDATGRQVLQQRSSGGRTLVGTEKLVPGLYTVRCIDAQGHGGHSTWVRP